MDHDAEADDYFVNGNGKSHTMSALEIEKDEEADSLIRETADVGRDAFMARRLTFRKAAAKVRQAGAGSDEESSFHLLGFLRGGVGSQFSFRNFAVLASLGFLMLLLVDVLNWDLEHDLPQDTIIKPPHQSSFGGSKNPGHYQQPSSTFSDDEDDFFGIYNDNGNGNGNADDDSKDDWRLPKSNLGDAIPSISLDNDQNANGHYLHDPFHSPYASPLYKTNADPATPEAIQQEYEAEMQQVISKWGEWVPPDSSYVGMPQYSKYPFRDIPSDEFPQYSWQLDENYLKDFLGQGKELIKRVKNGIYAEYGYDSSTLTGTDLQEMRDKQDEIFSVLVYDYDENVKIVDGKAIDEQSGLPMPGIAHMNTHAWEGLVRKLLHAVVTSDDFFVVTVGSASTYRGNNFFQSQVMQFNRIMEPVLDKLGVRLIARNMGMDASTTISALGGKSIYGESDILWIDPSPGSRPEAIQETAGQFDLLHRQAILSGERLPLILTPAASQLAMDTNGKAWLGNIQPGADLCGETVKQGMKVFIPDVPACQYLRCTDQMKHGGYCEKHNSVCWVDRTTVWNPDLQDGNVGYQNDGYANYREHQWEGRKLTLLVLHALEEALDRWGTEMQEDQLPLADDLWHVGPTYKELRDTVRSLERLPGKSVAVPPCEHLLRHLDPMICHLAMHAMTEWTPRVTPVASRLKAAVVESIADENSDKVELYTAVDLFPMEWKIPSNQVDLHMIAIATNDTSGLGKKPSDLTVTDDFFSDDDEPWNADDDGDYGNRRMSVQTPKGWLVYNAPIGFCDGSAQSRCNRMIGNPCLLSNYNHYKAGILGHGGSDWLTLNVGAIKEGIILGRFDFGINRSLADLPDDFLFEYSVGGNATSLSRDEFVNFGVQIVSDLWVFPFLIDREMSHNVDESKQIVVVAIRVSSSVASDLIRLTHVYYA